MNIWSKIICLHVPLLYSAQSFKKLNFSQRVPIQEPQPCQLCGANAEVLSLWPFWCLDSLENNYYYTTVQTHTASSPNPRASAHGTVQRRALSHGPALNHRIKIIQNKNTSETKNIHSHETINLHQSMLHGHTLLLWPGLLSVQSHRGETQSPPLLLRAALLFHTVHLKKRKEQRQN